MQSVFSIDSCKHFSQDNFIVSSSNEHAYKYLLERDYSARENKLGVIPFANSLLLIGPESSGKSFLSLIFAQAHQDMMQIKIIEDIDEIAQSKSDNAEEQLLHQFNHCHENQIKLLMTATRRPVFALQDLASRINSVYDIELQEPDDDLIKMLTFKIFSEYSANISLSTINYIMRFLPRNFKKIFTILECLLQSSLAQKRKITIPFIKQEMSQAFVE